MSTPHEKKLNREKQKRFQERHRARLRWEREQRALQEAAMRPETYGQCIVTVVDGKLTYGAPSGPDVAVIAGGLSLVAARRICHALRRMTGEPRAPRPNAGVPVIVAARGKIDRYRSISEAARVLGTNRMKLWRDLIGCGDCSVCNGWTDLSNFVGFEGADYTAWRGCTCK